MPNRIIKESIRTSKKINTLTDFEFRFWTYLITYVDDFGRGSADPELINSIVFPRIRGLTDDEVASTLSRLDSCGCIKLYEFDGEPYFYFPNWGKHQTVRNKKSKYPDPCASTGECDHSCTQLNANECKSPRNPIQSNPIRIRIRNTNASDENNDTEGKAVRNYLDRINPEASRTALEAILSFEKELSADVCIRAFDIAIDEKKTTWSYIHAILRDWKAKGIRCVADLEGAETKRNDEKPVSRGEKKYKIVMDKNGFEKCVEDTD